MAHPTTLSQPSQLLGTTPGFRIQTFMPSSGTIRGRHAIWSFSTVAQPRGAATQRFNTSLHASMRLTSLSMLGRASTTFTTIQCNLSFVQSSLRYMFAHSKMAINRLPFQSLLTDVKHEKSTRIQCQPQTAPKQQLYSHRNCSYAQFTCTDKTHRVKRSDL